MTAASMTIESVAEVEAEALFEKQSKQNATIAPFAFDVFWMSYLMTRPSDIATDYAPALRTITEAEQVRLVEGENEDTAGRRLRKSTRASAYVALLKWRRGEADKILSTGFSPLVAAADRDANE